MPDENTPVAESSPLPPTIPTDPGEYQQWRQTGRIEQPKAAPAPAQKSSDAKPEEGEAEGSEASREAPESDTGKATERKPGKAEARLNELLEDLKRAGLSPKELKTFRREAQKAAAAEEGETAKPKAAPEKTDKPAELKAPTKPKESDYKTWEEYEAAKDQYHEDLAEFKARKAVEEDRAERRREAAEREMTERLNAAKAKYQDDAADKTIISTAKELFGEKSPVPAVIREVLNESEALVDVLYTLGKDSEGLEEFLDLCKTKPGAAMRKAVLIEKLVMEELSGKPGTSPKEKPAATEETPERDASGKFVSSKKETKAPPPPRETSGRSGPPADEVERAIESGDFRAYQAAQNRRDLARRQGR